MPPDRPGASTETTSSRPVCADVTTTATAGGVLVAVTLRNDTAVDVRVRVENDLDGPVLPPRREGVPAPGWDEGGFTGVVPADGGVGIGYACPTSDSGAASRDPSDSEPHSGSEPESDPISLEILGPAAGDDPPDPDHVAAAVRSLGRSTPPADAVPTSATVDADGPATARRSRRRGGSVGPSTSVPPRIAAWFDAVETRIERAEQLTDATADGAAAVLEDCGVDGVADLPDDIERDLASLRAAADRIEALVERATATDPEPVVSSLVDAADGTAPTAGDRGEGSTAHDATGAVVSDSGGTR